MILAWASPFKMRLNRHNGMALYHWVRDKNRTIYLILKLIIFYLFMFNVITYIIKISKKTF